MKKILLTQGKYAKIDNEDFALVSEYKWRAHSEGYAVAGDGSLLMHRLIMNTPADMHTDHINHDKLDNRRSNLRVCDRATNMQNRLTKSGHRGYINVLRQTYKEKIYLYYRGRIRINGVSYHTKAFKSRPEAVTSLALLITKNGF